MTPPIRNNIKQYLGDGVYADISPPLGLVLTTENGIEVTNTIVIESEVWSNLLKYVNYHSRFLIDTEAEANR